MITEFKSVILPLLFDSKSMLRKIFSPSKAREKIKQMRITRKHVREASDLVLYKIIQDQLIPEMEDRILKGDTPCWYWGTLNFVQKLKGVLARYEIENNQVINPQKRAAAALFELVQLNEKERQQAINHWRVIKKYGNSEQFDRAQEMLSRFTLSSAETKFG